MILESVEHSLLIWPTIEENRVIRTKKYVELSVVEKIQADCDTKATNIILQDLPSDIYSLVNHHRVAKDLWERIQLLMQGTSLTKQERECKLYDAFDKFAHIKEESLHQYYLRFTQLINDMNIYNMKLKQFRVNTKFLNSLPPEWSKFMTDVKLVKYFHTTTFDQLHAYLEQRELYANEVCPLRDDPIACLNKAMAFLTVVASSRFPSTNNQLKTSSNLINQATIQDDRVTVQQVQGRQGQSYSSTMYKSNATSSGGNNSSGQERAVKCCNCQEVPHFETYLNDMKIQTVLAMQDFKQPPVVDFTNNEIHSDSNIIPLTEDFRKHFTPQQELSAEQAFWLRMSDPTSKPSDALPIKIEAPKELLKISLVNESLKKLKFYLAKFDNVVKIRTTPNARTEEFFVNNDLKAQLQDKDSTICKLKDIIKSLREKSKEENVNCDYGEIETKNVELENGVELLVYVRDTCPNAINLSAKKVAVTLKNKVKKVSNCGSKPSGNKKNDRISQTPSRNIKNKVEAQPRNVNKKNRVVEPIRNVDVKQSLLNANSELICATCKKSMFNGVHDLCILDFVKNVNSHAKSSKKHKNKIFENLRVMITSANVLALKKTNSHSVETQKPEPKVYNRKPKNVKNVVQIVLWYLDSRCSKHMAGNRSQLMNFVSKFLGIVRFENDHIARIMGYGDYELGNVTISRVYYTLHEFYENVGISHQTSVARTPQQNGIVERRNRTLVKAAHTMLIFSKDPLFLWAKAINTACYTQNRSLICIRYKKTPYELMQDKKPDLSFFHVFCALCYPTNENDDLAAALRVVVLADSLVSTSIDQVAPSSSTSSTQEQEQSLNNS
nr:retrovirus-related Pol polyprotein from transposon TNT 1-94 [Tanacetum cinerariifolium]